MTTDEFFAAVAGDAEKLRTAKDADEQRRFGNQRFIADIKPSIVVLMTTYRDRLRTNGINAEIDQGGAEFDFKLRWQNGEGMSFRGRREPNFYGLECKTVPLGVRHSGRISENRKVYERADWQLDAFEEQLQHAVQAFMSEAHYNGGI